MRIIYTALLTLALSSFSFGCTLQTVYGQVYWTPILDLGLKLPVGGVKVRLNDRVQQVGPFGYFQFDNVDSCGTYILTATKKQEVFDVPYYEIRPEHFGGDVERDFMAIREYIEWRGDGKRVPIKW